jgi:hypothetical protein
MNMDDPFADDDDDGGGKPPAKRTKRTTQKFCEFCGRSDHVLQRSKKCANPHSNVKLYRKDGTLLSEPARTVPDAVTATDAATYIAATDCSGIDALPWDTDYTSEPEVLPAFFNEDAGSDDDDERTVTAVGIVRANI